MKEIKIILIIITLFLGVSTKSIGQTRGLNDNLLIQGKWKAEQDDKSIWEFKDDGKLYSYTIGRNYKIIYRYYITSTPPICPDATLSEEENIKYLRLVNEKYNTISCFYIYGLNDERLTVMDAVTGHIFPNIKIED